MQDLLAAFEEKCRETGLRLTFQRMEIFQALAKADDHPSAEMLYRRLKGRISTLSLDTVYRTLTTFARHGIIHKVETVESQGRFEVILNRHQHVICRQCKRILDFEWPAFDEVSPPKTLSAWGRIESKNAVLYGICRSCQAIESGQGK